MKTPDSPNLIIRPTFKNNLMHSFKIIFSPPPQPSISRSSSKRANKRVRTKRRKNWIGTTLSNHFRKFHLGKKYQNSRCQVPTTNFSYHRTKKRRRSSRNSESRWKKKAINLLRAISKRKTRNRKKNKARSKESALITMAKLFLWDQKTGTT